ncbi:MAG: bifunctional phosphopantothenoylcysteine decarboxylase/phosphopantothenate--cysteine ligase CoaBC [Desulfobulbus propionicus]|nr:MAG: bifunctional phosphopantothenoylcysteine decarboxylase/phosphopantothenate--cysteine ligase CoaBC [Desulfobulbus propionicus]
MNPDKPGLQGIRVLLAVTGSIAAYKAAGWVRELTREEALVSVMMTGAAEHFISPLTFSALSGNRVYTSLFDEDPDGVMAHISLPRENNVLLIAPATAQTIARLANGLADDLVSTAVLAADVPVLVCPAMNANMFRNQATQRNIEVVKTLGYHVLMPDYGELACGEIGAGRLPGWETVREELLALFSRQDLSGKKIVITAGPTREAIDPVRFISNRSSGKMGYALARSARRRGGKVTIISGPVALPAPPGIDVISVQSAREMEQALFAQGKNADVVIKAAAVADYRPPAVEQHKIKKKEDGLQLNLVKNDDILTKFCKQRRPGQVVVGFAAESRNHKKEGRRKLGQKNVDIIVVNDILGNKTGFDVDTNKVTLIEQHISRDLPFLSKEGTANRIIDAVVTKLGQQQ